MPLPWFSFPIRTLQCRLMELLRGLDVVTWGPGHEAVTGQAGNSECSEWEVEGAGKSARPLEWGENDACLQRGSLSNSCSSFRS